MAAKTKRWTVGWILLSLLTMVSVVSAFGFGPRPPREPKPPIGVAEPAAIALLGAGLVTLGFYAKKKRGKKN
jgi:hypothetical protein